jgi:hypothetical protein
MNYGGQQEGISPVAKGDIESLIFQVNFISETGLESQEFY